MDKQHSSEAPTLSQLKVELEREHYKSRYRSVLWNTFFVLVIVAAFSVLAAMLWLPVLEIYGESMAPTLTEGEIVVSVKTHEIQRGDLIAFYFGNKVLVKRCIALPGDTVSIDQDGFVFVNDVQLEEPYVSERTLGECDLEFPYIVPQERYFLLGDHRETSIDSRSTLVGSVSKEDIVGRLFLRLWPLEKLGTIGGSG